MEARGGCPSDDLIAALVDEGALPAEQRAELHRHIATCAPCLALLTEVTRASTSAQSPAAPAAPATIVEWERSGHVTGDQVGPYRLVRLLGRGAMGSVYLARDMTLGREVAIKFINASTSTVARQRFQREAQAVARLRHENVLAIYGVGQEGTVPYQVSEYVDGHDLTAQPLPYPLEQVLRIASDLSAGLAEAHDKGVIHRDIKPSNVMLTRAGQAKLVDFGLARLQDEPDGSATREGALIGTLRYMSPEALRGQAATPQCDIYSLGTLLWELATGQLPVPGRDLKAPPELGPRLGRCLLRCLDMDPARRFPNGAALHAALRGLRPPRRGRWTPLRAAALVMGVTIGLAPLAFWRLALRPPRSIAGMVRFSGGTFRMGHSAAELEAECNWQGPTCLQRRMEREQPSRLVTLSPFYLDKYEVTNAEFLAFLRASPQGFSVRADRDSHKPRFVDSRGEPATLLMDLDDQDEITPLANGDLQLRPEVARHPVQSVSWDAARRYCEAQEKRLPTEAEWEFAAGGGNGRRYPWGDAAPRCDGVVIDRAAGRPCAALSVKTVAVGTAPQDVTPDGIHDLGGNVTEWVQDRFQAPYPSCGDCRDPVADWKGGDDRRVLRGGSALSEGIMARSTGRGRYQRSGVIAMIGFRCAAR